MTTIAALVLATFVFWIYLAVGLVLAAATLVREAAAGTPGPSLGAYVLIVLLWPVVGAAARRRAKKEKP